MSGLNHVYILISALTTYCKFSKLKFKINKNCYTTPHTSSNAEQSLAQVKAADKG